MSAKIKRAAEQIIGLADLGFEQTLSVRPKTVEAKIFLQHCFNPIVLAIELAAFKSNVKGA